MNSCPQPQIRYKKSLVHLFSRPSFALHGHIFLLGYFYGNNQPGHFTVQGVLKFACCLCVLIADIVPKGNTVHECTYIQFRSLRCDISTRDFRVLPIALVIDVLTFFWPYISISFADDGAKIRYKKVKGAPVIRRSTTTTAAPQIAVSSTTAAPYGYRLVKGGAAATTPTPVQQQDPYRCKIEFDFRDAEAVG